MTALQIIRVSQVDAVEETAWSISIQLFGLVVCLHIRAQSILAVTIIVQTALMQDHSRTVVCRRAILGRKKLIFFADSATSILTIILVRYLSDISAQPNVFVITCSLNHTSPQSDRVAFLVVTNVPPFVAKYMLCPFSDSRTLFTISLLQKMVTLDWLSNRIQSRISSMN